jgi:hypothetical protein
MVSPPPRWFDDEQTTPFLLAFEQARHLAAREDWRYERSSSPSTNMRRLRAAIASSSTISRTAWTGRQGEMPQPAVRH